MKRLSGLLLMALALQVQAAPQRIVLRDDQLVYNGTPLQLGQSLAAWGKVLPGKRRCEGAKVDVCVWDAIGLQVVMQNANPAKIASAKIFLHLPDPAAHASILPKRSFAGQLELDAFVFGLDTKFWEVARSARPDRKIRCGLRDCALPSGALGDSTVIYFDLSKPTENGVVHGVTIGGTDL